MPSDPASHRAAAAATPDATLTSPTARSGRASRKRVDTGRILPEASGPDPRRIEGGTISGRPSMAVPLQITNPRERRLVRLADVALAPLGWRTRRAQVAIRKILLLRLERIGDLLMTLEAVAAARRTWPDATIDLAVGSWNKDLASLIPGISHVHVADLPWLSRGERATSWPDLVRQARAWRTHRYDLIINFEPDIRTNFLAWIARAPMRVGYATGGGGALLTQAEVYDPTSHVSINATRLVASANGRVAAPADVAAPRGPRLAVPSGARSSAMAVLEGHPRPWIGVHAAGGRESKQWHPDRFAATARTLATITGGTIVLTGGPLDRPLVDRVAGGLEHVPLVKVVNAVTLPELTALLEALDLFVTGDTGPMHLAAAVGTPVVALFGPSDPKRYGPRALVEHIIRVDLPCSPCGQVRLPPERCRGHVPDCMDGITVDAVVAHALDALASRASALSP